MTVHAVEHAPVPFPVPKSHCSLPATMPSPQTVVHAKCPPLLHFHPLTTLQAVVQPPVPLSGPVSHASLGESITPSPRKGPAIAVQVLPASAPADAHVKPVATWQVDVHPLPATPF